MQLFENDAAIVTGAGNGIGRAIAQALVREGVNTLFADINADTVAGAIATALKATRLYMLTDVAGVLNKDGKLIPTMSVSEAQQLIEDGTIQGGMIPKIENCIDIVKQGVNAATIIDGRVPHAILVELFTKGGAGTQITQD